MTTTDLMLLPAPDPPGAVRDPPAPGGRDRMSQMEPVFCHSPETLRLVQVVRLIDECLPVCIAAPSEMGLGIRD